MSQNLALLLVSGSFANIDDRALSDDRALNDDLISQQPIELALQF